jgi:hypothetical protein
LKWLLLLLPGGCIALVVWEIIRRRRARGMSGRWMRELRNERRASTFVSLSFSSKQKGGQSYARTERHHEPGARRAAAGAAG